MSLSADCSACVGLCCIIPGYGASTDFAFGKAPGEPCRYLASDRTCSIHTSLVQQGMRGCVTYDCFGAGQATTSALRLERGEPLGNEAAATFRQLEALHEVLWLLDDAARPGLAPSLVMRLNGVHAQVSAMTEATTQATTTNAAATVPAVRLEPAAVQRLREEMGALLSAVSADHRSRAVRGADTDRTERRGDLVGAPLAGRDLRAADLRGRLLLGADLRGADLRHTDLLGADLRGADLRGADLREALFLTVPQLRAAVTDRTTRR
ncbi:MAG: pentapeptide repeat-containing protein [Actinomycetales bacterium]